MIVLFSKLYGARLIRVMFTKFFHTRPLTLTLDDWDW